MLLIFILSIFLIVFAMVGYPLSLKFLDKLLNPKALKKKYRQDIPITLMIVAHNEEKVIRAKLENAISLNYPKDLYQILVASDNSNDKTDQIVEDFIEKNDNYNITLYRSKEHKGKTNAQNEAQRLATGEIIIFTDANSILDKESLIELVASFTDEDISYVSGKLDYLKEDNNTSKSESTYWNLDLYMRDVESRIKTITAGNGALYACLKKDYIDFEPILCHDTAMPLHYALNNKRAIFNPKAIAYEKSGSNNSDEFARKVRINRGGLEVLGRTYKVFKTLKFSWFTFFYFGHRFCRNTLWLSHLFAFISSFVAMFQGKKWGKLTMLLQILFGVTAIIGLKFKIRNKYIRLIGYYCMTVFAQFVGTKNSILGKSKAVWNKAESTR